MAGVEGFEPPYGGIKTRKELLNKQKLTDFPELSILPNPAHSPEASTKLSTGSAEASDSAEALGAPAGRG